MAPNKSDKKDEIRTMHENKAANSVANGTGKGLMNIAEVRMVLYVVPIALILATIVYFLTH
ncbi:MAG: hypothetical protein WBV22_12285 [Anaerolineaceae bacterium]